MTGHAPHIAPQAYLFVRYAGLDPEGIAQAEAECDHYIHESYKEFLSCMNGARLCKLSLHGTIGAKVDRSGLGIGQPISIRYQNVVGRWDYIPAGHLGIGGINGAWASQGDLYLTSTGAVELNNAKCDMIGATWPSFAEFLQSEIPRQLSLHDETGRFIAGGKHLPGNTDDWEAIAEAMESGRKEKGLLGKLTRLFKR